MRVAAIVSCLLLCFALGCTSKEARIAEQRETANAFFDKKEGPLMVVVKNKYIGL